MNYTIEKIHIQTVRLSLDQSELEMKIDQLKDSKAENNIKSI
ncbi:hypothetical protein [Halanaerobium sp. ST460_2HS_T2]|nr:hypothetical protein [Halanaerobium sp. ST460_2HS_T2]